jgi:hypothetical protein
MTDKVTLANLASLENENTAINTINANSAAIVAGFDNTLSRDGTSPNQMGASLDMNSYQILNLPSPGTINSPARLADVTLNPTITVPPTGTSGATVPFLNGNNTWSGSNTYTGSTTFSGSVNLPSLTVDLSSVAGAPVLSVTDPTYGLAHDGSTDDYTALAALITTARATGATVYIPAGVKILINMSGSRASIDLSGVNLIGGGAENQTSSTRTGSWIYITGTSNSPFTINTGSTVQGISFLYPSQTNPASLTSYPATIGYGTNNAISYSTIKDCIFVNSYDAINLGTSAGSIGYVWIDSCGFGFFDKAIICGTANGECWFTNNDFSPTWFFYFYNSISQWTAAQTAMEAAIGMYFNGTSTAAFVIEGNVFFQMLYAIEANNASDAIFWSVINNNNFDACFRSIFFSGKYRPSSVSITGNTFNNQVITGSNGYHIFVNTTSALYSSIAISGNSFFSQEPGGGGIFLQPSTGALDAAIAGNSFYNFGGATTGNGIYVNGSSTNIAVSGNTFNGTSTTTTECIQIAGINNAAISANMFLNATYGVVTAGTIGGVVNITDNVASGVSIGTSLAATGTHRVTNNSWNTSTVTAAATMGTSPYTVTAGSTPETHYVNQSATNTATINKGSQKIATLAGSSTYYTIELGPGESYVTTWTTTAPTYTKDTH